MLNAYTYEIREALEFRDISPQNHWDASSSPTKETILIDPTVSYSPSEAGKGGIVQWFPDLINAGKNLGAAQKRAIGSVEAQG